jgi:hypothetical protein
MLMLPARYVNARTGVRMFEKWVNYQISIFGVSLKKLTADGCASFSR